MTDTSCNRCNKPITMHTGMMVIDGVVVSEGNHDRNYTNYVLNLCGSCADYILDCINNKDIKDAS